MSTVSFNSINRLAVKQYADHKCDIVNDEAHKAAVNGMVALIINRQESRKNGVSKNASCLEQVGEYAESKATVRKAKKGAKSAPKPLAINDMAAKLIKSYSKAELRQLVKALDL